MGYLTFTELPTKTKKAFAYAKVKFNSAGGLGGSGSPPVCPGWSPDGKLWSKTTEALKDPRIFALIQISLFFNQNFSQLRGNLGCYCCSEPSIMLTNVFSWWVGKHHKIEMLNPTSDLYLQRRLSKTSQILKSLDFRKTQKSRYLENETLLFLQIQKFLNYTWMATLWEK